MMKKNISGKAGRNGNILAARKQMAFREMGGIRGGNPWAWMIGGYVFGKVMDYIIEECFVAGTAVTMSDGSRKNIEDVKVGEEVLSYNVHTKRFEPKNVSNFYTQVHDLKEGDITVRVTFSNGVVTHNTIANPFWSRDKGFVAVDEKRCNRVHPWVRESNPVSQDTRTLELPTELRETATAVATEPRDVQALNVGDILYWYNAVDGRLEEVSVESVEHVMEPGIRTYDIEVPDNHTFFANGILTHNSGGGGGGNGSGNDDWSAPCDAICFTRNMKIETACGELHSIERLNPGDEIVTVDLKTGRKQTETILEVHQSMAEKIVSINGGQLESTENHLLYLPAESAWRMARDIVVGNHLLTQTGEWLEVRERSTVSDPQMVYNLGLDSSRNLNYLANGIVVHSSISAAEPIDLELFEMEREPVSV
jgi:hypothetical protein